MYGWLVSNLVEKALLRTGEIILNVSALISVAVCKIAGIAPDRAVAFCCFFPHTPLLWKIVHWFSCEQKRVVLLAAGGACGNEPEVLFKEQKYGILVGWEHLEVGVLKRKLYKWMHARAQYFFFCVCDFAILFNAAKIKNAKCSIC